jgi:hypothetical protein
VSIYFCVESLKKLFNRVMILFISHKNTLNALPSSLLGRMSRNVFLRVYDYQLTNVRPWKLLELFSNVDAFHMALERFLNQNSLTLDRRYDLYRSCLNYVSTPWFVIKKREVFFFHPTLFFVIKEWKTKFLFFSKDINIVIYQILYSIFNQRKC